MAIIQSSSSFSRSMIYGHWHQDFWQLVDSNTSSCRAGLKERILPQTKCSHSNRVYAISDLHTDYKANMDWVNQISSDKYLQDTLIVAGDVSDNLKTFAATMSKLREKFAHVFFVPGNHDLWCRNGDDQQMDSLQKLHALNRLNDSLGVKTRPMPVNGIWIIPLLSWYHQSFDREKDVLGYSIPSPQKACVDYHACKWPATVELSLAAYFDELNSDRHLLKENIEQSNASQIITFSHFLPRQELCPEKRMLFYPHLPKVMGSDLLEERLRSIHGINGNSNACHVFGHTHFSWDATIDGIRYIQSPLAYPRERERRASGGEWLPLCIFDSETGLIAEHLACYWSDYYRHNKRDPDNIVLAPWVASLYRPTGKSKEV